MNVFPANNKLNIITNDKNAQLNTKNRHTIKVCKSKAYISPTSTLKFNGKIDIVNYQKVSNNLCRGAQPDIKGLKELSEAGVKTIVNLRKFNKLVIAKESFFAKRFGINVVKMPLSPFKGPSQEEIEKFFKIVEGSGKVFVHCRQGRDRTGTMVALYRMQYENWSFEKAFNEMLTMGHNFSRFPKLEKLLKKINETVNKK